ncbi:MAG: RNA polymerase sigma factor RpoD/SigA [Candidatus Omnitrophota bacterium]|jgi:RNA polymerase primary sigma factor|nr:MAG: RNA polymerase sigma factor RpoD/SigA [Candidatus Omnitrophota bacterium]
MIRTREHGLDEELNAIELLEDPTDTPIDPVMADDYEEIDSETMGEMQTVRRSRTGDRYAYNPVKEYLREIGNYSLLSREDEVEIYQKMDIGRQLLAEGFSRSRFVIRDLETLVDDLASGARSPHITMRNPDAGKARRKTELAKTVKEMKRQTRVIRQGFKEEENGKLTARQLDNRYKKWSAIIYDLDLDVNALWRLAKNLRNAFLQMKHAKNTEQRRRLAEELGDTPKRQVECYKVVREGLKLIREARQAMIRGNLRLVVSVAKRYKHCGIPMLDLIQEGNLGLTRAVDKFDYTRGTKFSTYAVWWIRQSISRAVKQQRRTIRLPTGVTDQIAQVERTNTELTQLMGRDPTVHEIANYLGMEESRVIDLMGWQQDPVSLETPVREDRETTIGELIKDSNIVTPQSRLANNVLRKRIEDILCQLSEREETILRLRYGLTDGKVWKLGDIGKRFGITRERVRQIEQRAIRKLRHPLRSREIRDFLN